MSHARMGTAIDALQGRVVPEPERHPAIPLQPGENWRFHFDMAQCVGCKCCEVACHEQNANPAAIKWRHVGEMEGGQFPATKRLFMSMACNHCLEPSCLKGCPVDAYTKDPRTGVVLLKSDVCIGCQYCTWNCPYGAPQFDERQGVVTKCDLCHNRLSAGDMPACVGACPSGALQVESFDPATWRLDFHGANAPGVPEAAITLSTTRITQPKDPGDVRRIDEFRLEPEKPHYSLIALTVLTQLSVGALACLLSAEWASRFLALPPSFEAARRAGSIAILAAAGLALGVSVFHLGRPLHAWRALKMWRRSWISREVLLFSIFAGAAALYGALAWQTRFTIPSALRESLGVLALASGLGGIYASARIYQVPARPSWNTRRTPVAFFATAFVLGPLVALLVFEWTLAAPQEGGAPVRSLVLALLTAMLAAGFAQLAGIFLKLLGSIRAEQPELAASARLLTQRYRRVFLTRLGSLLLALLFLPLAALSWSGAPSIAAAAAFTALAVLALASEAVGRYLFFVTVVPQHRPEGF